MSRYAVFIRNVMVGRQGLTQIELLRAFTAAGALEPVSHLSTGNVSCDLREPVALFRARVEAALAAILKRSEPVFVRPLAALRAQAARDPFAEAPKDRIHERCVLFTGAQVTALAVPLETARGDAVVFAVDGPDVFAITRLVGGRPGSPGRLVEKALGRPLTTRNWNTILHILAKNEGR